MFCWVLQLKIDNYVGSNKVAQFICGRAVIDTPHIDVPTIAVNRCLQFCYLDALIDASR